jgi:hypothetical protein
MPRWFKFVLIALLLLLLGVPLAMQWDMGSLEGVITDAHGPLKGAYVTTRNVMSGAVVRVQSDASGHYDSGKLRGGRYSLWIEASDHDSLWIAQVVIARGQVTHRDIQLSQVRPPQTGYAPGARDWYFMPNHVSAAITLDVLIYG